MILVSSCVCVCVSVFHFAHITACDVMVQAVASRAVGNGILFGGHCLLPAACCLLPAPGLTGSS